MKDKRPKLQETHRVIEDSETLGGAEGKSVSREE
jgi:hypothetical protein